MKKSACVNKPAKQVKWRFFRKRLSSMIQEGSPNNENTVESFNYTEGQQESPSSQYLDEDVDEDEGEESKEEMQLSGQRVEWG